MTEKMKDKGASPAAGEETVSLGRRSDPKVKAENPQVSDKEKLNLTSSRITDLSDRLAALDKASGPFENDPVDFQAGKVSSLFTDEDVKDTEASVLAASASKDDDIPDPIDFDDLAEGDESPVVSVKEGDASDMASLDDILENDLSEEEAPLLESADSKTSTRGHSDNEEEYASSIDSFLSDLDDRGVHSDNDDLNDLSFDAVGDTDEDGETDDASGNRSDVAREDLESGNSPFAALFDAPEDDGESSDEGVTDSGFDQDQEKSGENPDYGVDRSSTGLPSFEDVDYSDLEIDAFRDFEEIDVPEEDSDMSSEDPDGGLPQLKMGVDDEMYAPGTSYADEDIANTSDDEDVVEFPGSDETPAEEMTNFEKDDRMAISKKRPGDDGTARVSRVADRRRDEDDTFGEDDLDNLESRTDDSMRDFDGDLDHLLDEDRDDGDAHANLPDDDDAVSDLFGDDDHRRSDEGWSSDISRDIPQEPRKQIVLEPAADAGDTVTGEDALEAEADAEVSIDREPDAAKKRSNKLLITVASGAFVAVVGLAAVSGGFIPGLGGGTPQPQFAETDPGATNPGRTGRDAGDEIAVRNVPLEEIGRLEPSETSVVPVSDMGSENTAAGIETPTLLPAEETELPALDVAGTSLPDAPEEADPGTILLSDLAGVGTSDPNSEGDFFGADDASDVMDGDIDPALIDLIAGSQGAADDESRNAISALAAEIGNAGFSPESDEEDAERSNAVFAEEERVLDIEREMDVLDGSLADLVDEISEMNSLIVQTMERSSTVAERMEANERTIRIVSEEVSSLGDLHEEVNMTHVVLMDIASRLGTIEAANPADAVEVNTAIDELRAEIKSLSSNMAILARMTVNGVNANKAQGNNGVQTSNTGLPSAGGDTVFSDGGPDMSGSTPPAADVSSDVEEGDFVEGYGYVLQKVEASGDKILVIMENGSVIVPN